MVTSAYRGLYVHVPFCHSKCHYCDFYSKPSSALKEREAYVEAVAKELEMRARGNKDREWDTVYIGGGTPSLLEINQLGELVASLGTCRGEFTVEANPEDVDDNWLVAVKSMGCNRISMGVQSFDDEMLRNIGRRHTSSQAVEAIEKIQRHGFNYSIDLIYGLPGQSLADWESTLDKALAFRPPHFSAYLLSYEHGTRLYARLIAGKCSEAPAELCNEMYEALCSKAAAAGYRHYEVSNFAIPGMEARHNSAYWDGTPYLGLGPGAHSFDGRNRSYNPSDIKDYLAKVQQGIIPAVVETESDMERANDIIITALRTDIGLDTVSLDFLHPNAQRQLHASIGKLSEKGLLVKSPAGRWVIPERHWLISDSILRSLILTE